MAHIFTNTQIPRYSLIRVIFCSLFFAVSTVSIGQTSADKKAVKLLAKADEAVKERNFEEGIEHLRNAIGRDSAYAKAYVKLFELYNVMRQTSKIHDYQLLYVKHVPDKWLKPQIWASLAHHEMAKGEYRLARDFLAKAKKKDSILFNSIAFALAQIKQPDTLIINELPPQVNKFRHQYLPVLTVDSRTLIYTAIAEEGGDEDIVQSSFDGKTWSDAKSISENINSRYNEGACSISADGRTLIFTSCEGRRSFGNCDLYISRKIGDEWSRPQNLGKEVNSSSWDSQPTLSADGKTLYFVSTRSGGVGGRDIWVTNYGDASWSKPKNLGSRINTKRDETTPFIHPNNTTLFFSSNGHVGMGGFDLLKSERDSSGFVHIENLGFPINTYQDEVSLFITSDGGRAFFAKEERAEREVTSSELVTYAMVDKIISGVSYVTGKISNAKTLEPLRADLELIDLSSRSTFFQTESDSVSGEYFLVLPSGKNFGAFIEKAGYLFEDISFTTSAQTPSDTIDVFLDPVEVGAKLVLENVYFDFDSDELDRRSFEELEKIVKLLKDYPLVRIEISGHTDNVGSKKYNQDLSERRAKRIHTFLIQKGIASSAIQFQGYADTRPAFANDTNQGRARNRRIEIEIVAK